MKKRNNGLPGQNTTNRRPPIRLRRVDLLEGREPLMHGGYRARPQIEDPEDGLELLLGAYGPVRELRFD